MADNSFGEEPATDKKLQMTNFIPGATRGTAMDSKMIDRQLAEMQLDHGSISEAERQEQPVFKGFDTSNPNMKTRYPQESGTHLVK